MLLYNIIMTFQDNMILWKNDTEKICRKRKELEIEEFRSIVQRHC